MLTVVFHSFCFKMFELKDQVSNQKNEISIIQLPFLSDLHGQIYMSRDDHRYEIVRSKDSTQHEGDVHSTSHPLLSEKKTSIYKIYHPLNDIITDTRDKYVLKTAVFQSI